MILKKAKGLVVQLKRAYDPPSPGDAGANSRLSTARTIPSTIRLSSSMKFLGTTGLLMTSGWTPRCGGRGSSRRDGSIAPW